MKRIAAQVVSVLLPLGMLIGCGAEVEEKQPVAQASLQATAGATPAPRAGAPRARPVSRLASAAGRGRLRLVYARTSAPERQALVQVFRQERLFDDVVDDLNAGLVLPHDVQVRLQECGEVNAFYDPNDKAMLLCWELFDHFTNIFEQGEPNADPDVVATKAVAAMVFVFYHELGHALIDVYHLPVTGREEDAVDQLATVLLLETWDGEDSELAILSSAEWFELDAQGEEADMADEHSLDEQRYYNLVCWIFGSDPDYFATVADDWGLPPARADRCSDEYSRMSDAWGTLLGPHMRPVQQ